MMMILVPFPDARECTRIVPPTHIAYVRSQLFQSMIRALICTSLGLEPSGFRSFNVQNGGISVLRVNQLGETMVESSNQIAHMYHDGVVYSL